MNGMKNEPNWQTQNYRQNNYSRGNQWGQRGNRGEWRRGPANQFQSWNQGYRGNQNARNFRNQRGQRWTPGPSRNPNSIPVPSGGTSGARGRGTNFQRGTYRINETSFPYICFLAMICLILPLTNGQFQICPNFPEGTGIVMNFPKDHNCTIKLEEIPELVKIHIFVPIRLPKKFPVVRCQKWIVRMCTESYLGIYSKEKDANIVFTKISKEECWHTWDTQLLQRRGENVWQTPSNWDKEYSFFGVKCKNVTGTTLEEGSGAILDGRKLVTSWGDEFLISKKQDENEGWTKTQEIEEILMWRIPDQTYWNTHFRVGPVSAEIWSPRAIVVDELQYSFIYHKNATHPENMHGLPELAIRMENDVFVEIIEEKLENKTRVKKQSGTGFLKKNRKLFEGRTTTQGTTLRVQGVETTIPATVTQKPITRREETRTPIWKVTPSTRNLMPVTERPSVISVPTTPKGITATRKLSLTTPSTTRPLTTTLRARTTSRTPIIPNTSRRLVFTTAGTPRKFITTTTPRRITSTPSTTTRRVTYSLRPATKIRTSTQSASTTRKTEITTKTPAIIEKPLSRLKPEGQGDEIKKIQIPQKLIATTEKSTTTVVIKRDVSEKPWFDPGDESHSNSRLNYLDWKTEQRRVVEAREKWINDCHNRNTQLAIARTLAREMPEQAARSLYNRDDITAYLLNSQDGQLKWQINRCQQVKAESIEWNQMIGQDCYKEIPVTVKNRKYFLKPGGRDLKEEGIKINCSQKKKISDQKSKNTTKMEELNLRESFKSSPHINRQNPLIFNLGSIFESEQNRLDQNLQDLTKRVNRPELTFPEDEVSEDEIPEEKNITRGTVRAVLAHGNKAIQTVIEQGNVIITKSTEVIEKGTNFLQDPFGIMSTIKMIVIIMACVAILIGLCVIYWKGKIYFMIVINGARTGIRLANTILNLIKPRRQSRPLTVAAVEKRLTPTAPLAEEGVGSEEQFITVERQHQYFPLRVGKCLVKPMAKRIVPLRLMNYGNSEIKIHANSKLADLEPIGGGPEIKTITERDELCMTDKEWKEFKEEVDQIPEEANWIKNLPDEPLNKQEKPVFEKISLEGTILSEAGTTTRGKDWAQALPLLAFAYNTSLNLEIGQTPFFVTHGWNARLPSENALNKQENEYENTTEYARELKKRMEGVYRDVKNRLESNAEKMKRQQKLVKSIEWLEGDLVLIKREDKGNKFDYKFRGPFKIVRVERPNLVVEEQAGREAITVHMDKCKKYNWEKPQQEITGEIDTTSGNEDEAQETTQFSLPAANASRENPEINTIRFTHFNYNNKHNYRLNKYLLYSKMSSTNEVELELLGEDEMIEVEQNIRWGSADKEWTPLCLTWEEKQKLDEKKEAAENRALEKRKREYKNYVDQERDRRKIERGKRHHLKEIMKNEKDRAIKFANRMINSAFRFNKQDEGKEEARRKREHEAFNRAFGWPPPNDIRREKEKQEKERKIREQITEGMFEKYIRNNTKRVNLIEEEGM
uniref:Uncharacterized protein n=1 Tax=Meloidogyne floridensis TaxID=298350 RepID=A0A915PAQ7_9BILA